MASYLLLIVAGLVGVCCFFGAAVYLMSVANEIKVVKTKTRTAAGGVAEPSDHRLRSR